MSVKQDFLNIARVLGEKYAERAENGISIWTLEREIEKRRAFLTPANGWPGSNAEMRKASAESTYRSDLALASYDDNMAALVRRKMALEEEINGLEATRRAMEWGTRADILLALHQHAVNPNGRGDPVEAADDDLALARYDDEIEQAATSGWVPPDWLDESRNNHQLGAGNV
jgi:hypothetical protein